MCRVRDGLDAGSYLLRGERLLLHSGRNRLCDSLHLADTGADVLHGAYDGMGCRPDFRYLLLYFTGRLGGLCCKTLYLTCNDSESLARIAGARRFDCRIERQQIGLTGDLATS